MALEYIDWFSVIILKACDKLAKFTRNCLRWQKNLHTTVSVSVLPSSKKSEMGWILCLHIANFLVFCNLLVMVLFPQARAVVLSQGCMVGKLGSLKITDPQRLWLMSSTRENR